MKGGLYCAAGLPGLHGSIQWGHLSLAQGLPLEADQYGALEGFLGEWCRQHTESVDWVFGPTVLQDWGRWRDLQPCAGQRNFRNLQSVMLHFTASLATLDWSGLKMASPPVACHVFGLPSAREGSVVSISAHSMLSISEGALTILQSSEPSAKSMKSVDLTILQSSEPSVHSVDLEPANATRMSIGTYSTVILAEDSLEDSLPAPTANLTKICLKMKDFEFFAKKVNFPGM